MVYRQFIIKALFTTLYKFKGLFIFEGMANVSMETRYNENFLIFH